MSIWNSDVIHKQEEEASSGSGKGFVALTEVKFGYKVFASGVSNEDSFFGYEVREDMTEEEFSASQGEAKRKAQDFVDKLNEGIVESDKVKKPSSALALVVSKDETYGLDTSNWQGDRWFLSLLWWDYYKELLKPNLEELGVPLGESWLLLKWKPNPFDIKAGKEKPNLVVYPAQYFESKAEALDFVANTGNSSGDKEDKPPFETDEDIPEGYDADSWAYLKESALPAEFEAGKTPAEIAKEYSLPLPAVLKVKKEI